MRTCATGYQYQEYQPWYTWIHVNGHNNSVANVFPAAIPILVIVDLVSNNETIF